MLQKLNFPAVYYDGHVHFYERASTYSPSYFGGPSEITFSGLKHGSHPLHHIMTFNWQAIPGINAHDVTELPLFYGMRYSGCILTYDFGKSSEIQLLDMEPKKSSADWPYLAFPELLPYFPIKLSRRVPCSQEQFSESLRQHVDITGANEVVVVVPPIFDLGISLWGPSGDAEGVHIIFRCDLEKMVVKAYNQCG